MERNSNFPRFWSAVLILIVIIGIQIILSIAAYDFGYRFTTGDPKAVGILTVLSCGIMFSALMSYKNIGYKNLFHPSQNTIQSTVLLLTLPIAITIGGAIFWISDITNLISLIFPMDVNDFVMFTRLLGSGVVSIITVCFIAPIIEEMLFRGIILRGFLNNYSPLKSIFLSAFLFAAYHLNIHQLPVAFFLGCLTGWLYVSTQSLWPCIMGHFLYNTFTMLYFSTYEATDIETQHVPVEFNSAGEIIASVFLTIIGIGLLIKLLVKPSSAR